MTIRFVVERPASKVLCEQATNLDKTSFALTCEHFAAHRKMGDESCLLVLKQGEALIAATAGHISVSLGFYRTLRIPAFRSSPNDDVFWSGLLAFCSREGIAVLEVNTFGSTGASIPSLPGETSRIPRREYHLDLTSCELEACLHKGHRRHINKARKSEISVRRTTDMGALEEHAHLIGASMTRRRARGESVKTSIVTDGLSPYIECGAGELFQAVYDEQVVSSVLILRSPQGGYYQSAGTSPDGMKMGASHFLVHDIALQLQRDGLTSFSLGGVSGENPGLSRFKAGFGCKVIDLEQVLCEMGNHLRHRLIRGLRLLRSNPLAVAKSLTLRREQFCTFVADPAEIEPLDQREDVHIEKITQQQLEERAVRHPELRVHVQRISQLGFNDAYGLYVGDELAHVAWLITANHDALQETRNVCLREGEAEITHCITLPNRRGQGLYVVAIQRLCQLATNRGLSRVYMITNPKNEASRRGILKAGLAPAGRVVRYLPCSLLLRGRGITLRGHRRRK